MGAGRVAGVYRSSPALVAGTFSGPFLAFPSACSLFGGRVGGFVGPAGMEKAVGEHQKRLGIVRVGREDGAGGCLGVAPGRA